MKKTAETFCVQATGGIDSDTGAVVPPVHISTTFERAGDNSYPTGYIYGRPHNRTVQMAEDVISELEGGAATRLFASGMAAATALFLALPRPTHIVAPTVMYWGLRNWLATAGPSHGIATTFVDASDPSAIAAAIRRGETSLVWVETPSNPLWTVVDIKAAAEAAHAAGADLAVDSTAATPVLTHPLALGADIVMHSATKYLNGHSDVLAGSLTFAESTNRLLESTDSVRDSLGAVLQGFEAALLVRGLRTLFVRVERQCQTALALARRLAAHPGVAEVLYPGLESHPGHALAARQMAGGFGGMLSIRVADAGSGGEAAAIKTAAGLQVWKRATSLGGVESLVEHRASIEGPDTPCPSDLLRLSVGLEAYEDLAADLEAAIDKRG